MLQEIAFQAYVTLPFEDVVEKVIAALKQEGFGVLTRIDVEATLKEKLDEDFRPYVILGACNPPLAHRALVSEPRVGVMLPCNVTIETSDGGTLVCIANPEAMLTMGDFSKNHALREVATEARNRLERVIALL